MTTAHVSSTASMPDGEGFSISLYVQERKKRPTWIAEVSGTTEDRDASPMRITVGTFRVRTGNPPENLGASTVMRFTRGEGRAGTINF